MSQEIGQTAMEFAQDLTEVPSVLRYSDILKVGSPIADLQYTTLIPSNGATFSPNQQIRIPFNVPTDAFANLKGAYLKMKVNNNTASATGAGTPGKLRLDQFAGVGAFIDTWRIVSGTGSLVEEIIHYNAIYSLMSQMIPTTHSQSSLAIQDGAGEASLTNTAVAGAGLGDVFTTGSAQAIARTASATFTHIPMSGLFQCDRLVPFGFATGTSYVEITLPSAGTPLTSDLDEASEPAWTITEVELHVPVLRMSAEFNNSFRQLLASGIPINWHSQSFHNVQTNVASGTTGQTTLTVATRKRSVKSVITMFRKTADLTDKKIDSSSARKHLGITEYSYTIGGVRMPSKNVKIGSTDLGEVYANLVSCLSNLGNVYSGTAMDRTTLRATSDVGTGASKIAYALDLEAYGHSDVQSGKNLANQGLPLVFEATLGASGSSGANNQASASDCIADVFLLHDVVYSLDGVSGNITANA
jgi:hypothetical protein